MEDYVNQKIEEMNQQVEDFKAGSSLKPVTLTDFLARMIGMILPDTIECHRLLAGIYCRLQDQEDPWADRACFYGDMEDFIDSVSMAKIAIIIYSTKRLAIMLEKERQASLAKQEGTEDKADDKVETGDKVEGTDDKAETGDKADVEEVEGPKEESLQDLLNELQKIQDKIQRTNTDTAKALLTKMSDLFKEISEGIVSARKITVAPTKDLPEGHPKIPVFAELPSTDDLPAKLVLLRPSQYDYGKIKAPPPETAAELKKFIATCDEQELDLKRKITDQKQMNDHIRAVKEAREEALADLARLEGRESK